MKDSTQQTVELSKADLEDAVQQWLAKRFSGGGWKVVASCRMVSTEFGPFERDEPEPVVTATRSL